MSKATDVAVSGYSADTEILTRTRSWVPVTHLTLFDEVATRTPDGIFTWEHPDVIAFRRYSGDMIHFRGRSLDLMVTPGHPMRWTRYGGNRAVERPGTAAALEGLDGACLVGTSTWDGPDLDRKVFRPLSRAQRGPAPQDFTMTGDQYAAFMGMYLSEGCFVHQDRDWRVLISQTPQGKGYEEYRALLIELLGREPGRTSGAWAFCSRALVQNLALLGKGAKAKQVPADILGMSRRQLEIFWRFYWLGDGAPGEGTLERVATASRVMAGNLQEVIQKRGFSASAIESVSRPTALVATSGTIYKLGVRTTRYPEAVPARVPYAGTLADVRLPSGSAYVRRNGRAAWAGA